MPVSFGPESKFKDLEAAFKEIRLESNDKKSDVRSLAVVKDDESKVLLDRPEKIGYYSVRHRLEDDEREYVGNASELKYLHIPSPIILDLTHGYDKSVRYGEWGNSKLDKLLKWISINIQESDSHRPLLDADFVTTRRVLAYIMTYPYQRIEQLTIAAVKFRGNIYLCPFWPTQQPKSDSLNQMSFSGYRFEKYLTSTDPNRASDLDEFDRNGYIGVIKTQMTTNAPKRSVHSVIFTSKLDCLADKWSKSNSLDQFVELKCAKKLNRHKLLQWWAHTHLIGVPIIHCGIRDDRLMVKTVQEIKVDSLRENTFWTPEVCLNFMNDFLTHVKQVVIDDNPDLVYLFECRPRHVITCTKMIKPTDFEVLPNWYVEVFKE
ncbi:decapping and exoribonuclease protein-like [Oppia nitens]|uniref:decapping and exoribonuclease protein-like n=1 Tax=Oppia nitens TaxID=1686743 RepID=UPI0023DC87AD|nr:decapping and exoribonuclease protein-like [Oppia nitens]